MFVRKFKLNSDGDKLVTVGCDGRGWCTTVPLQDIKPFVEPKKPVLQIQWRPRRSNHVVRVQGGNRWPGELVMSQLSQHSQGNKPGVVPEGMNLDVPPEVRNIPEDQGQV